MIAVTGADALSSGGSVSSVTPVLRDPRDAARAVGPRLHAAVGLHDLRALRQVGQRREIAHAVDASGLVPIRFRRSELVADPRLIAATESVAARLGNRVGAVEVRPDLRARSRAQQVDAAAE